MRHVTTAELIRSFGTYSDIALSEPVVITKNGRERLALLNVDEYNFFRHAVGAKADPAPNSQARQKTKRRAES
jgi:PHD/YefM family antitoxin component YafN of YafNO toxin-antitoxin module